MWQPDQSLVQRVTNLITETFSGISNVRQSEIANEVTQLSQFPEYSCALICILNNNSLPLNTRLAAGHSLKSTLEKGIDFPLEHLTFLQQGILNAMDDIPIAKAISNIATTLYITQDGWPQLLAVLTEKIENSWAQDMGLQLFEDISTYNLLSELLNSQEYSEILKELIKRLMILIENSHLKAVKCMNQLVQIMPSVVIPMLQVYLDLLIRIHSNKAMSGVVAEGILAICSNRKDLVWVRFPECADIMLYELSTSNARTATSFWTEIATAKELLSPYLLRLLSNVIDNLKVQEQDLMDMLPEKEDFRFEKYEEENMNWTLRRESALLIDKLAESFGAATFGLIQEKIQSLLLSNNWIETESGLLALGAIASGAISAILPSLPTFLPFLQKQTSHEQPMVRSMALWAISRFTENIVGTEYFKPYLESIMRGVMDKDGLVQRSACTSFCILICHDTHDLGNYLEEILHIFAKGFEYYSGRALLNLLDAIASICDVFGEQLRSENFMSIIIGPLFALWNKTPDNHKLIWTLCETLVSLALALGACFSQYGPAILERCERLIQIGLTGHEKQFAMKGLELSGAIIEISETLPNLSSLAQLAVICLNNDDIQLKQYAGANIGDLVILANSYILSLLPQTITQLTNTLQIVQGPDDDEANSFTFATNNSASALGEISIYNPAVISPEIPKILDKLIPIAKKRIKLPQVRENLMAAIGKFGLANPEALAEKLSEIFYFWCEVMQEMGSSKDKEMSFKGMTQTLILYPSILNQNFQFYAVASVSYRGMPADLEEVVRNVFIKIKEIAGNGWEAYISQIPVRKEIYERFGV
ncbi:unnamed protein product [Blepharisma stoltei]|uniref:Importin N-terminal domain-containing protein n=1 Tax=Blepharisma stoltei TaxID=1481888 RepID=A0AAU9JMR5_9CILI|nr:unnamed protein product [Blepharisma stoltei]